MVVYQPTVLSPIIEENQTRPRNSSMSFSWRASSGPAGPQPIPVQSYANSRHGGQRERIAYFERPKGSGPPLTFGTDDVMGHVPQQAEQRQKGRAPLQTKNNASKQYRANTHHGSLR